MYSFNYIKHFRAENNFNTIIKIIDYLAYLHISLFPLILLMNAIKYIYVINTKIDYNDNKMFIILLQYILVLCFEESYLCLNMLIYKYFIYNSYIL